jgi:hypothetical protein
MKFKMYYKYKRMQIYIKLSWFKKSLKDYVTDNLFCPSRQVEYNGENKI